MDEVTSAKIRAGNARECRKVSRAIKDLGIIGAAESLGISRATLYRWIKNNDNLVKDTRR